MRKFRTLVLFTSAGVLAACSDPHSALVTDESVASFDLAASGGAFGGPPSIVPFTG